MTLEGIRREAFVSPNKAIGFSDAQQSSKYVYF